MNLPDHIDNEQQLEDILTTPSPALLEVMRRLDGDLMILGVAGKMGPTLARLARRALDETGSKRRVIGVARFSDRTVQGQLESAGVETIAADLLADHALVALPNACNVIYLAGRKFGSTGDEALTWAMNTYMPARVADRYRNSRIVTLSTGNVYPLVQVTSGGATETTPPEPLGEYAQSCLGRERLFEYFSRRRGTPVSVIRLNYAVDLRYGVLVDIALKVLNRQAIDLAMGYANVIWQGDANAAILRSLDHCASPPFVLNVTGPDNVSIREAATRLGTLLGQAPVFAGKQEPTALLSNAGLCHKLMGPPTVSLDRMLQWVAHWVRIGGRLLNKATHFETRDGRF